MFYRAAVKCLLSLEASVSLKDNSGCIIKFMFYRSAVECLLSLEASVSLKDNSGCTPLHLAAWKGYDEICKLFLSLSKTAIPIDSQVNSCKIYRSIEMNIVYCFSQ